MRAYGVKYVGPCCAYGCCWRYTTQSGRSRKKGHGAEPHKKRARADGKRLVAEQRGGA
jgi:hypothetical protein